MHGCLHFKRGHPSQQPRLLPGVCGQADMLSMDMRAWPGRTYRFLQVGVEGVRVVWGVNWFDAVRAHVDGRVLGNLQGWQGWVGGLL